MVTAETPSGASAGDGLPALMMAGRTKGGSTMKFIINETGETKALETRDINGIDWTRDLIGNSGAIGDTITYDEDSEVYRINQDDYDWRAEYIDMYERFQAEYQGLCDKYGAEAVDAAALEIDSQINDLSDDYNAHEQELKKALDLIRFALES